MNKFFEEQLQTYKEDATEFELSKLDDDPDFTQLELEKHIGRLIGKNVESAHLEPDGSLFIDTDEDVAYFINHDMNYEVQGDKMVYSHYKVTSSSVDSSEHEPIPLELATEVLKTYIEWFDDEFQSLESYQEEMRVARDWEETKRYTDNWLRG